MDIGSNKNCAVFLDRDGTIIEDNGHLSGLSKVVFFEETVEALMRLSKHFLLFIVTNQSGVARGLISREDVNYINSVIVKRFTKAGIDIQVYKDVAMQVAAMNPISVYREEIPKEIIEKEIEIYKEIALKEGKPEQIVEKIAAGKLNKFYQENCLSEQSFIKDNSKSVNDLIKEFNANHHTEAKISRFHRFHLGDENK